MLVLRSRCCSHTALLMTCVLGTDGSIFYKLDEQNAVGNAWKAAAIANQDKKVKGA